MISRADVILLKRIAFGRPYFITNRKKKIFDYCCIATKVLEYSSYNQRGYYYVVETSLHAVVRY